MSNEPRIPLSPPIILPLKDVKDRPLWSVMIPAYNCSIFLSDAIQSVLDQDPGEDIMQIEVVDDASTDTDVEALVKEIGKGRVKYFRQPYNRGSLRNFETCINRAKGHFIHLLHGDDMVKPGFYNAIKQLFDHYPDAGAAFTKNSYIDEYGIENSFTQTLHKTSGILEDFLLKIAEVNYLQTPSIVVKREVYESLGAFYAVHYGEDWEMWARIAANYPIAYTPKCYAMYRGHLGNITNESCLSGQGIKDVLTVVGNIKKLLPEQHQKLKDRKARFYFSNYFTSKAMIMLPRDPERSLKLGYNSFLLSKRFHTFKYLCILIIRYIMLKVRLLLKGAINSLIRQ